MVTLIAVLAVATTPGEGVSNVHANGPSRHFDTVRDVARTLGRDLYAPDDTARGFSLRTVESAKIGKHKDFAGLGERTAVRMTFINKTTSTAFDIYQVPSGSKIDAAKHLRWIIGGKNFEAGIHKHDTFVAVKRGDVDLCFVGGLVSEPSAKELLSRLVLIKQ